MTASLCFNKLNCSAVVVQVCTVKIPKYDSYANVIKP